LSRFSRLPIFLLSLLLFSAPGAGAAAQEAEPAQESESHQEVSPPPPPVSSPWRSAQFAAPLEKVRAELLALIQEDRLGVTGEEKAAGTFVTGMVEFDDKKFGVDVSIPPPKLSNKYPYAQLNAMTSGRYGLEGRLQEVAPDQTRLDLRALLEIRGLDHRARTMRWIPRVSNGEVERNYFTRLSLRLLRPQGASPPAR